MLDSVESPDSDCSVCGCSLEVIDINSGLQTCHECRSPVGKVNQLEIAISASGDTPERLGDWSKIRYLLRKRFGDHFSNFELWERCIDWLHFEGGFERNEIFNLPLTALIWFLRNGFPSGFETELEDIRRDFQAEQKAKKANRLACGGDERRYPTKHAFSRVEKKQLACEKPNSCVLFSRVDRFPLTEQGNLSFLECLRDEIHDAAKEKRKPLSEKRYSNDQMTEIISGPASLKDEANRRIVGFEKRWPNIAEKIKRVLRRELNLGTVERIDELLRPAVRELRDAWEERDTISGAEVNGSTNRADSPSRVKARAAYDYAMERIPNANKMTAPELFEAIKEDGEAATMLPPTAGSFTKYLNDCGIRIKKSGPKDVRGSIVTPFDL